MALDNSKRCHAYRNLNTGTWSLRQSGLVVAHPTTIFMRDCRFLVQPAGREKTVRERRKRVHAYISGYVCTEQEARDSGEGHMVRYDPYEMTTFIYTDTEEPVHEAAAVVMDDRYKVEAFFEEDA